MLLKQCCTCATAVLAGLFPGKCSKMRVIIFRDFIDSGNILNDGYCVNDAKIGRYQSEVADLLNIGRSGLVKELSK